MRPPSNWVAAHGLRASDTERDEAISELRSRFAEGRLSQETFLYRMDVALRAKDQSELSGLFVDLPTGDPGGAGPGGAGPGGAGRPVRERFGWLRHPRRALGWSATPGRRLGAVLQALPPLSALPPMPLAPPQPLCLPRQEDGKYTIGRAPTCDFTVSDLSVSRWHARLQKEDQTWVLSDLGSTNGTRLNGWRVTAGVQIRPGDQVSFGSVRYVITAGPAA